MGNKTNLNNQIATYRRNFYNVYHSTIIPIFQKFETERKNQLTILLTWIAFTIITLFISIKGLIDGNIPSFISIILIIIGIVLLLWLPFHYNNKFVDKLKSECMHKILEVFGKVQWYDKVSIISDTELNSSDLFSAYNRREAKDAFSGNYKGVKFQICETHLYHESGSGKNRRVIEVFNGVVIKFKSNKDIRNKTIIATKGDTMIKRNNYFGLSLLSLLAYGILDSFRTGFDLGMLILWLVVVGVVAIGYMCYKLFWNSNEEVLNEIKLEDPEFTKKYKAYSSDQVEGRYLITAAFMERFKNLQTSFGTKKAKCSFYGDDLMFAISTNKNLFEIGNLFFSLNNPKQMETFFEELTSIFMLVDYFKLDEKTGL